MDSPDKTAIDGVMHQARPPKVGETKTSDKEAESAIGLFRSTYDLASQKTTPAGELKA
jgi:hypothetical protein